MSMHHLNVIKKETFSLETLSIGGRLMVRFTGSGHADAAPLLERCLKGVDEEAARLACSEIVVDFQQLYFMNSSCLKAFVSWIYRLHAAAKPARVRFMSNARLRWQESSLGALGRLAPEIVTIEAIES
ncbi:MAG TPA: hypothetical protein VEK07_25845 [Polyangiaceae bacterium]|nr:hypothetical protein [Polyangiaceae bacterium]